MKMIEILRMILVNLIQNKFKVLLTSLGIIVGTVTIVLVIGIGQGGEDVIAAQFSGMSAETIYINPNYSKISQMGFDKFPHLTEEHIKTIKEENPALYDIYIRATSFSQVVIGSERDHIVIVGVTEGYSNVSNLYSELGEDLAQVDMEDKNKVAVIGNSIAKKYFATPEDAIGSSIKIGSQFYKIIGVLERKAEGLQGINPDGVIFIPYSTGKEYVLDDYAIPQVVGLVKDISLINKAMLRVRSTLDFILEDGSMYEVEDAGSRIEAATKSARTMKMLLISVALIVFLVGGIGIMNVLFVSVKERTREIGILKALGTSKRDILMQFLLESISMGVFGGGIGIILSHLAQPLMKYTDIPVVSSVNSQIIALCFAVATAGIFGFYPAYKASELKPIDALNYE